MAKTGLLGPYPLGYDDVAAVVSDVSPGVFALGYTDLQGAFRINSIGRSDQNVAAALHTLIGSDQSFKFDFASSSKAAFERECALFHDFRPPCTRIHPSRPEGSDFTCPRCGACPTW